ncbi:MAG TPA: pyridoxine 5'-phosphate synthase [bacterium]|nr:pyridoxine 5'-phosphate synthase [bacterium]HOL47445.1 pyridoxine 5'-phosphate synthase [bacterium]HPQ19512.1 pyridoxine 5'-phosphate synthase [bacterium]
MSIKLGVNIDHIATLREARKGTEPEPIFAAGIALNNGADGITIHLREDRRHIQDRDLELLRKVVDKQLNLEMALSDEIINIALKIKPDQVTLVPERREEVTTEGGLDLIKFKDKIKEVTALFQKNGIVVSYFIEPDFKQVEMAKTLNGNCIELHTGKYANTKGIAQKEEYKKLYEAAESGNKLGLIINAGHGLNYHNIEPICKLPKLNELNIGHSIISRAIFSGLANAVFEMKRLITLYSK